MYIMMHTTTSTGALTQRMLSYQDASTVRLLCGLLARPSHSRAHLLQTPLGIV